MKIRVPSSDRTIDLADWLEAYIYVKERPKTSRSSIRQRLRGMLAIDGDDLDVTLELVIQELTRRSNMVGASYPFEVDANYVKLAQNENTLSYLFLLTLCASEPLRSEKRQGQVEIMVDMLVLDALASYLSGGSLGVHFGWPTSGNRPPAFPAAIEWLANQLGLKLGKGKLRAARQDGGVDVVVWRPFKDRREGFVTILAQCTIAVDWPEKAKDIVIDLWRGYIDFGKDPIACLAIPWVIPQPFEKWDELRRTVHFVLDRIRLCELLDGAELSQRNEISDWMRAEVGAMLQN